VDHNERSRGPISHRLSRKIGQVVEPDVLREACGVFGILAPGAPVAHLTYDGLYALQHRGQESAGMAVADGTDLTVVKDMGLVTNVFTEHTLAALSGHLAIGHTRYSTTGSSTWANAQPVHRSLPDGGHFALGHNGNLTNTAALAEKAGMLPGTVSSDSDALAELLAQAMAGGADLVTALLNVLPEAEGAFSLVLTDGQRLIGVRDPHGFRPLCLGRSTGPDGWVLASESPALDIVGASFERDVEPGEMVVIGPGSGVRSHRPFPGPEPERKLCVFELVYFARPDSVLEGREVYGARQRMGEQLAREAPLPPPLPGNEQCPVLVMGVPDSGLPSAEGFARASGLPYGQGLVKNRYIGRTFIAPDQDQRDRGVRRKLNPLRENIRDTRLVVLDDSIVRGTTSHQLVTLLRNAGAAEVHLRITSPPYKWPCFYGIDTGDPAELIAANKSVDEIREFIEADSLAYLSIEGLLATVRGSDGGFCTACLTGDYPTPVELTHR
jgi:amidophosphoribosyltransferase